MDTAKNIKMPNFLPILPKFTLQIGLKLFLSSKKFREIDLSLNLFLHKEVSTYV